MKRQALLCILVFKTTFYVSFGQETTADSSFRRHFVGSSAFMLGNFFPDPPSFYQLNYGYRLTKKDAVSVEAITWRYRQPLGIPYGPSFESDDESYPGYVRGYGLGLAYQRYLWRGLYAALHATPFLQKYRDEEGAQIRNGFQLFMAFRVGYHIRLFKDRFFLEPSVAATCWPINTHVPASFAVAENKWPNYFLFEPGLHFGIKF